MKAAFNGLNEAVVTFEAADGVVKGVPVTMADNGKVQAAQSGVFCGICCKAYDGYAAVQLGGYVRVPYTGTLTVGYQKLAAASGGKVEADDTNGREYLVTDVDTEAKTAGVIL